MLLLFFALAKKTQRRREGEKLAQGHTVGQLYFLESHGRTRPHCSYPELPFHAGWLLCALLTQTLQEGVLPAAAVSTSPQQPGSWPPPHLCPSLPNRGAAQRTSGCQGLGLSPCRLFSCTHRLTAGYLHPAQQGGLGDLLSSSSCLPDLFCLLPHLLRRCCPQTPPVSFCSSPDSPPRSRYVPREAHPSLLPLLWPPQPCSQPSGSISSDSGPS